MSDIVSDKASDKMSETKYKQLIFEGKITIAGEWFAFIDSAPVTTITFNTG
jgi:hypothetical protein